MMQAIQEVRSGAMKLKTAAIHYNVPSTTLYRRVKSEKDALAASTKKLGRFSTVFSKQQEQELTEYIFEMESRLFGIGTKELRVLAFQFAEKNDIPNTFNKMTGMAGRDWIYGFLKRQKTISLRLPENT